MDASGPNVAATFENGSGAIILSGKSITNGFLSDTFVNTSDGVKLYTNEIMATPEPSTYALMVIGGLLVAFSIKKSGIASAVSV